MTVAIAGTWTGGYAPPGGFSYVVSATSPSQVNVANSAGDWMIAVTAWQQPQAGAAVSACMSDDQHNWWEPVGAPAADSPAAGLVRCSVWAAPAARAAAYVQACPTAPYTSLAAAVYDVSGIGPGWAPAAIGSNSSNSATSLTVPAGSVATQSLVITILGSAQHGATVTPPSGWTALTGSTILGLGLASQSITVSAAYQVITGSVPAAAWSVSGSAVALAGVTVAIPLAAAVPALKSPNWPAVITEAAIGSGPQVPPSQAAWTDMSARSLALSVQQGRQYTLSALQAGQGTIILDNPDGALIPPGSGAFTGIDSGTPVRRRCYWPGGAWQVQWTGNGTTATPQAEDFGSTAPVTAGVTYSASAWLGASAPWAAGMSLGIAWKNSGGGTVSVSSAAVTAGTVPVLAVASGTAPAGAVSADLIIGAAGTPPASLTFYAAAGPYAAGYITPPPAVTWNGENNATVTTLAPWHDDPRGAPQPSPWYVPFSGFFRRWPYSVPGDAMRGQTVAEVADIWAYAAGNLNSMAREEMLLDQPYAMWPLDDAAGAPGGSNLAPGNAAGMAVVTSKLGAGGAAQAWGQLSGALIGDSSARAGGSGKSGGGQGMWQLTLAGTSLNTNGYGIALACQDPGLPSITGGITCETWFACNSNTNTTGNGFSNSGNTITVTGSGFTNGTPVTFAVAPGFSLPAGMTGGSIYYVIASSGATFQISTSVGGSAVALTTSGSGLCATTTPWNPHVMVLRTLQGQNVAEIDVRNSDGALLLVTTAAATGAVTTTVIDSASDYRQMGAALRHVSLALTATTYRVLVDGGGFASVSGSMAAIRAGWGELCLGGLMDRGAQGWCMPGYLTLAAVYPGILSSLRAEAHYFAGLGLPGDSACTRIDRILSYAGLAGRRWIGVPGALDGVPSGQDIGGQSASASASNIASSTVPAILSVAPTGDVVYWAKQYAYNQPVKWVLGDNVAAGEIPFSLSAFATDYDPTRVYNDVQLTQLDTQTVTVPAGVTASTTVAAIGAASALQYGSQPYQQTAYLINDYSSPYNAGSGLIDLAAWIALIYQRPRNRVPAVTINAAAHPSAWPLWGQAATGDMVQVNVRLPTAATSPIISVIARVTQTNRSMKWATDGAVGSIALALDAAPEYQALICDDAVRGLLNGQNVLAW